MTTTRPATLAEAINATLRDLLANDPRTLLIGQDIGRLGGVFRVTRGLLAQFGPDRVRDALLAESTVVGQAIGMAISGLVPICEIQFDGFVYPAVNQLVTQAARIAERWNGLVTPSLVVRIPSGGGTRGVEHHGDSNESLFARVPGIAVACPAGAEDYAAVLRHAVGLGRPVIVYEPIRLYWRRLPAPRAPLPAAPMAARVLRPGRDLTVATYGAMTHDVLAAAEEVADRIDVEVVDLRWVAPLDVATVLASVARTGRLLVAHEAGGYCGIGAELAAAVAEHGFDTLRGPVRRLTPPHRAYPPADRERDYLVSADQIKEQMLVMTA